MKECKGWRFLRQHCSKIIQKTNNVINLADELYENDLIQQENYSEIAAQTTEERKMRKIFMLLNSNKSETYVYNWLKKNESHMMEELENNVETEAPEQFRTESDEGSDETDCTNKPPDLKVLHTMAKLDEYVSNPEINEVLINKLRTKLDPKDMETLENELECKRPKMSLCLNASDVNNIRKNRELKSFLTKTKNAKFPKIAYHLFFERDPDFTSANNSNIEENSEPINHEEVDDDDDDDDMCVAKLYNSEIDSLTTFQSPQTNRSSFTSQSPSTIQSHPQSDLIHHSDGIQTEEQLSESHCKSNKNEFMISQQTKLPNAHQTDLKPSGPEDVNDAMQVEGPQNKQVCKTKHPDVYESQQLNRTALNKNMNIQVNDGETNQHCEQREKSAGHFMKPKAEETEMQSSTDVQQDPDVYLDQLNDPLRMKDEDGTGLKKYMKWSKTDFSTETKKTDEPPQTHGSGPSDDLNGPSQQRRLIQKDFSQRKRQTKKCFIVDFQKTENPVQETDDVMDFQESPSEASKHSDFETLLHENSTNGLLENIHEKSDVFSTPVKTCKAPFPNDLNETFIQQHAGNNKEVTVEAVVWSEGQSNVSSISKNLEMESDVRIESIQPQEINVGIQVERPHEMQMCKPCHSEKSNKLHQSKHPDVHEPLQLKNHTEPNVKMNMQSNRSVINQHFYSKLEKENTLEQNKTHFTKFCDGPEHPVVCSGNLCQKVSQRIKTDCGIEVRELRDEGKTEEVGVCDQLQNEPAVDEMTGADEALTEEAMDLQNSLREANMNTDKETFYTEAGSGVKETEALSQTPGSKSTDLPSNELQPKMTCSQQFDQDNEQRSLKQRTFMEESVKEQLRSTCDPEKEQPGNHSGGDTTALDQHESQRKRNACKRKRTMEMQAMKKLQKREDQRENLRIWAMSQCSDGSEEEFRRIFDSISIKDVVEHKEYPFFTTRDVTVYKDPHTGQRQIISFEEKLTAEITTQLHYRMFVCDINKTVLLGSNKREISLDEDLVHVNSCLKIISECFIPAFALYKNIKRQKHLLSLLRASSSPSSSS